jgi:pectinesterase
MGKTMRIILLSTIILLLAVVNSVTAGPFTRKNSVVLKVTNSLNLDRSNEMIVLKWDSLHKYMRTSGGDNICIYDLKTSDTLISQFIDEDKNGIPEELIFCSNFKARETKRFVIKVGNKQTKSPWSLTYVCFNDVRDDIAWENDRIAYRIYGPELAWELNNGLDVWTKRVRYPVVDKWYKNDEATGTAKISYHEDHGEGADLFNVGRTLGAGSCALFSNDSLYQPGVFATYKILATGPLRAIFEVTYNSVKINGMNISEVKRYSLDAGSNLNKIEVTYLSDTLNKTVQFAAGLVKRKGVTLNSGEKNRWISLWGVTDAKEENGSLGTGIVASDEIFKERREDTVHVLLLGTARIGVPFTYYSGAGWSRSGNFNNVEEWNKYLNELLLRLKSSLKITMEINRKFKDKIIREK